MESKELFSEDDVIYMKEAWNKLCTDLIEVSPAVKDNWFTKLDKCYREKQRFYHNWFHIKKLNFIFESYSALIYNKALFALSLWFHDAIYDP